MAHEENTAVFVSSHMLAEMELMCDRVAIIDRGAVLDVKPIADILHMASKQEAYRFEVNPENIEKAAELAAELFGKDALYGGGQFTDGITPFSLRSEKLRFRTSTAFWLKTESPCLHFPDGKFAGRRVYCNYGRRDFHCIN